MCSTSEYVNLKPMQSDLVEMQPQLIEKLETERLSLAQELHDGAIQNLYGIYYALEDVQSRSDCNKTIKASLSEQTNSILQVIKQLRTIIGELRPSTLIPFGLEQAIRSHIEGLRKVNPDLRIQLELSADSQIFPERTRLALFRIYQNAISNVALHANAHLVCIRCFINPRLVTLEIQDDGCGFQLPTSWMDLIRKGHYGLASIAERTQAIGGQLEITSAPGKGTKIRVILPQQNPMVEG